MAEKSKAMVLKEEAQGLMPHIAAALPAVARKYLTPERLVKVALVAISRNPALLACTKESILRAMIDAATLGLELAGPLGHVYAVPYKNNKTGQYEMTPIIGYQGYLELARRSGKVAQVNTQIVFSGDVFELDLGSGKPPRHIVRDWKNRGEPLLAYCVARFTDGNYHIEVMTIPEIEAIRARSRAKDSGPWVTDYLEMCRKTVIRRARKYWPMIPEMAMAAEIDERIPSEASPIDVTEATETVTKSRIEQAKELISIDEEETPKANIPTLRSLHNQAKAAGVPDELWKDTLKRLGITPDAATQTADRLGQLADIVADWAAGGGER